VVRTIRIDQLGRGSVSVLLISVCPGPRLCSAVHTYLFIDVLDLITRSFDGAAGGCPSQLLRPGGLLHPTDQARTVDVAAQDSANGSPEVYVQVRLRGQTVTRS